MRVTTVSDKIDLQDHYFAIDLALAGSGDG